MASITIRNLEDEIKQRLRVRARVAPADRVDLNLPAREPMRAPR